MGWGIYMGISQDHSTFSAHAHLNLLGWVSCAIMGGFYALAKDRAPRRLQWVNFVLSSVGIGVAVGSLAVFFGMASFLASVIMVARKQPAVEVRPGASPENPLPQLGLSW